MIKVLNLKVEGIAAGKRSVVAELVADTKDEVNACGNSGERIVGLTADDSLVLGSIVLCTDGSIGMIDSTGQWKW